MTGVTVTDQTVTVLSAHPGGDLSRSDADARPHTGRREGGVFRFAGERLDGSSHPLLSGTELRVTT